MAAKTTNKRGRLSADEISKIEMYRTKKTPEAIAALIRRPVYTIERYLAETEADGVSLGKGKLLTGFEDRPEWAMLEEEFDDDELKFFKYRYVQYMDQFGKDDVLPTEEVMIFDLIRLEIQGQRTMGEIRVLNTRNKSLQRQLEAAYADLEDAEPKTSAFKAAEAAKTKLEGEHGEIASTLRGLNMRNDAYMQRKQKLLQDLKATRDQRVKAVEGSKQSFGGLLKALMQEEYRKKQAMDAELMRLALSKEQARLESEHTYMDGTIDHILLTPGGEARRSKESRGEDSENGG